MGAKDISPEVVGRAIMLVRRMATAQRMNSNRDEVVRDAVVDAVEARAIVALLPEPEPTDPDVLLMREIMHAAQWATPETRPDGGNMSWLKGSYDHLPQAQAVLAAIKQSAARRQDQPS